MEQQKTHAGKAGSELIKICRAHLGGRAEALAVEIASVLDQAAGVLERRHEVVHSVSVQPGDSVAYAHQPLRPKNRPNEVDWIGNRYLTTEFLSELDHDIQATLACLYDLVPRAAAT